MKRSLTTISLLALLTIFSFGTAQASGFLWFLAGAGIGSSLADGEINIRQNLDPTVMWIADSTVTSKIMDPLLIGTISSPWISTTIGQKTDIHYEIVNSPGENAFFDWNSEPFVFTTGVTSIRDLYHYLMPDTISYVLLRVRQYSLEEGRGVRYLFDVYKAPQPNLEVSLIPFGSMATAISRTK